MLKVKWKPWQKYLFLGYLLILNLIVFGTLTFLLVRNMRHRQSEAIVTAPTTNEFVILPTSTSLPQPTRLAAAQIPAPNPVPSVNIPPAPIPKQTDDVSQPEAIVIVEGSRAQTWTATPSITPVTPKPSSTPTPVVVAQIPTFTPSPSPTLTPLPTPTPSSTATPTASPTNTPKPTATPTSTPTLTPLPTATPTLAPSPTSTPTQTSTATPTVTQTPTRRPTATPTFTLTPSPIVPSVITTLTSMPQSNVAVTSKPGLTPTVGLPVTPRSSPTSTIMPTTLAQLTSTPTPQPKSLATPAVVAAALKTEDVPASSEGLAARPVQPNFAKASGLVDAVALTNSSIGLSWAPVARTAQYRVYSDMGSGFGVYLYKTEVNEPAFVDKALRAGVRYSYRVTHLAAKQEVVLAQTEIATLGSGHTLGGGLTSQRPLTATTIIPVPTALPPDAVILGLMSDNSFTDDFNTLNIVGEVRNDSPSDVGQAHIAVTFYDSNGAIIGTADGETLLEVIPPGETAPFLITVSRPAGFTSYSLRAVGRPVQPKHSAQLAVVQVKRFEDEAGFFHIRGIIQNTGSVISERTKVAAIIYGRGNNIINLGFTYVDPPTLAPGERANFEVIFTYYPKYVSQKVIPFQE